MAFNRSPIWAHPRVQDHDYAGVFIGPPPRPVSPVREPGARAGSRASRPERGGGDADCHFTIPQHPFAPAAPAPPVAPPAAPAHRAGPPFPSFAPPRAGPSPAPPAPASRRVPEEPGDPEAAPTTSGLSFSVRRGREESTEEESALKRPRWCDDSDSD